MTAPTRAADPVSIGPPVGLTSDLILTFDQPTVATLAGALVLPAVAALVGVRRRERPQAGSDHPSDPSVRPARGEWLDLRDPVEQRDRTPRGSGAVARPVADTGEHDPRVERATAAAERAIHLLRSFRSTSSSPIPAELALVMEAAASARLGGTSITEDDLVGLLRSDPDGAHGPAHAVAHGLAGLLDADEAPMWELARRTATELGGVVDHDADADADGPSTLSPSPATLAREAAAVLQVVSSDELGDVAGATARALLATWPARSWRLDRVPLLVSASLEWIAARGVVPTAPALTVTVLDAIENAANRQLRAEQALAGLQRHYLDEWDGSNTAEPGARRVHHAVIAALAAHPVLDVAQLSAALDDDRDLHAAMALLDDASAQSWVRPLDVDGGARPPGRWFADEMVRVAWRVLNEPTAMPSDTNASPEGARRIDGHR